MNEENIINKEMVEEFENVIKEFKDFRKNNIPLCAAENVISDFSKIPLKMGLQERYILGGYLNYDIMDNMIGSEKVLPLYQLVAKQCNNIFDSYYCDCRSLSGMNGMINLLLALTKKGDTVLLSSPECGGHASLPNIIKRLGLNIIYAPFDYPRYDYDYEKMNAILRENKVDMVLLAPSDLITIPDFKKIDYYEHILYVFDASQVMGLIAGRVVENPLKCNKNMIILGGTHKTIPGVTKAIILTDNKNYAEKIDTCINPDYIRNTQLHHVASLFYTFLEVETFGESYAKAMIDNANYLADMLNNKGFEVCKLNEGLYTHTHQLFIKMDQNEVDDFYNECIKYDITLNKKRKLLYSGTGIGIGVQEITRYGWGRKEIDILAQILYLIYRHNGDSGKILELTNKIKNKKTIQYTFR